MTKNSGFLGSASTIPPKNKVKLPLYLQNPLIAYFNRKVLGKYGMMHITSYHKTRKKLKNAVKPYMPKTIHNEAYLYDFHAHTFHSDGNASYEEIILDLRRKRHLNGLCITDHPWHFGKDGKTRIPDDKVLARSFQFHEMIKSQQKQGNLDSDFITFPGSCEFFTRLDEDHPHSEVELIALGLPKDFISNYGGLDKIKTSFAAEFIEKVHEENGIVILPHPFYMVRAYELLKNNLATKNSAPDAFEVMNYTVGFLAEDDYQEFFERLPFSAQLRSIGLNFGYFNWIATIVSQENSYGKDFSYPTARKIGTVGSSDAHFRHMVGAGSTLSKQIIENIEDLREFLRKRQTYPVLNPFWRQRTNKYSVFREIWSKYGPEINKGLKEKSLLQWILGNFSRYSQFHF